MPKILIVGAGAGGTALLPILHDYSEVEVTGITDVSKDAMGLKLAARLGIPTGNDYHKLLKRIDADIIIDVSGQKQVSDDLETIRHEHPNLEIIEGHSAKLLFKLVDERRSREEEVLTRLKEQEALYRIGIMLNSSESEDELLNTILDCATAMTNTPAGSIALYQEAENLMQMVATQGFSEGFMQATSWEVRPGGLTDYILNQSKPVVIEDFDAFSHKRGDNVQLENEGIKALIAIPLVADRKTKGVLYVDDFVPRGFSKKDESILALLSTQAAIAIEKMQLFEKVKRLADTDGLTGLFNHRYFVRALKEELKRAKRFDHPLSVLIMDVDHFKHYNDNNGHLKGNEALKGVTEVMQKSVRKVDVLARYGGEEFAVVIPEADRASALKTAKRICQAIEQQAFDGEDKQPMGRLTMSIGVASFPEDAKREGTLLDRADSALYEAKRTGRNRVVAYGD